MREAILAELGLIPLWQIRPVQAVPQAGEYIVIALLRDDGKSGRLVMNAPLTENTASLLANVLASFRLQAVSSPQTASADFTELPAEVTWLWLAGVPLTQCRMVANMPVFVSVGLTDVVGNATQKSTLWADWCAWRF